MFEEDFLKWENGPVCRELFDWHRGKYFVSDDMIPDDFLSGQEISNEENEHIEQVLYDYSQYSGGQLSELTHMEDPWINAKKNEIIDKEIIKNYYMSIEY